MDHLLPERVRALDAPIREGFHRAAFAVEGGDSRLCLFAQTVGFYNASNARKLWRVQPDLHIASLSRVIRFTRQNYKPA